MQEGLVAAGIDARVGALSGVDPIVTGQVGSSTERLFARLALVKLGSSGVVIGSVDVDDGVAPYTL